MLRILAYIFAFVLAVPCWGQSKSRGYIVEVGQQAPSIELCMTNGDIFRLSDHKGKVVMLQFTASWCGVCRREMPFIEKEIWQPLKNKEFVVVAIDIGESKEQVDEFIKQTKITYPVLLDSNKDVFYKYTEENAGVTRNIILNEQGKIIFLTRLFDREEFDAMKQVIFNLVSNE